MKNKKRRFLKDNSKKKDSVFERHPRTSILFILIIFFFLIDVFLTKTYKYYKEKTKIAIQHPVYGHTYKKNSKYTGRFHNNKYTIYTNSLGFKDKSSREVSLTSSYERILFMGDSFTEGILLNYEDTFVGIIDSALIERNIQVLNAGRGGYSPINYWRKIKYLIEDVGLQFDEVFLFIDISDAIDETFRYLSDDNNVVLKDIPITSAKPLSVRLKISIYENTTVLYFMLKNLKDLIVVNKKKGEPWHDIITENYIPSKWTLYENLYNDWGKEGNMLMKKYMNKLLNLLTKNNIDLTIAVYPYPSQVWYQDLNSLHVKIWEDWAKKNNVDFINYFPDFIKKDLNENQKLEVLKKYYIHGDVHFNEGGNKIIANKFIKTFLIKD